MKHFVKISTVLILSVAISGCSVTRAGLKKGDERSFVGAMSDVNSARAVRARMTRALEFDLKGVDVEVAERIVLLSGNVPTQADKIEAERIAWSASNVDEVGNEILIKGKQPFIPNAKDGFLEKSVRARLYSDDYVKGDNLNIEVNDGIVYMLGIARNQDELERATQIAATTRGAREVVSYIKIAKPSAQSAPTQSAAVPAPAPLPYNSGAYPSAPVTSTPLSSTPLNEPIPFKDPTANDVAQAPSAPRSIDMGERLGKELPTNEQLGAYRTGRAGEEVSVIESAPYYLDPDTGKEIPIRYDADGNRIPLIIR